MTDTWYITSSTDGGYYLNNPETTDTTPNPNFEPYNIPAIWSKILTNCKDILIDSTVNTHNYVFMSKNPNQLEQFIHIWNSYSEQAADYIDWD
jgi:hypothetical protein